MAHACLPKIFSCCLCLMLLLISVERAMQTVQPIILVLLGIFFKGEEPSSGSLIDLTLIGTGVIISAYGNTHWSIDNLILMSSSLRITSTF